MKTTEKKVQKKIVLKVNDRHASQFKSLMTRLGTKALPTLVRKYEALELGRFSKEVLVATATGKSDIEKYISSKLKAKYIDAGVVEMLHPSLLSVAQPAINDFINEVASFKYEFDEQRHNVLGIGIGGTGVFLVENIPMKDDKIDVSDIQDLIDKYFTTCIESEEQEKLYNDLIALAKRIEQSATKWHVETGMASDQFIRDLFEYDNTSGSVQIDIDAVIWSLSFVKEKIPVG